jgi:XapX domain-containing protein
MKIAAGFLLAFVIGIACRLSAVPLPAPPVLIGALLVLAMSIGYTLCDRYASRRAAINLLACGGPTGQSISSTKAKS